MATRSEVYAKIKCLNLQEEVKSKCGRNFTQVPTADLEGIIEAYERQAMNNLLNASARIAKGEPQVDVQLESGTDVDIDVYEVAPNQTLVQVTAPEHDGCKDAILALVTVLVQKRIVSKKEADVILSHL
jgi:sRNA-binding carbon storage regulator CsrA